MSDVYETLYYEGEIERLEAELAEANAKIEKVRRVHSETQGRNYCSRDMQIWPCDTIRALANPVPKKTT